MRELAKGVWQLSGFPPNNINVYVLGDVLVDSGIGLNHRGILRQIADHTIGAHALTHAHFDHYGSSHAIREMLTGKGPEKRLAGTLAAVDFGVSAGAHIVRVHDVGEVADFLALRAALRGEGVPELRGDRDDDSLKWIAPK